MNLTIQKLVNKIKPNYIKGRIVQDTSCMFIRIIKDDVLQDDLIILNAESNRLVSGKGYIWHQWTYVKFIGLKGVTYRSKFLYKHISGDIVKGIIKDNEFYIK